MYFFQYILQFQSELIDKSGYIIKISMSIIQYIKYIIIML